MWIKAEKPVEKTGQVTSQAQNPLFVSMLLVCGGLVRRRVVAWFV
jgi:hypothetical protein